VAGKDPDEEVLSLFSWKNFPFDAGNMPWQQPTSSRVRLNSPHWCDVEFFVLERILPHMVHHSLLGLPRGLSCLLKTIQVYAFSMHVYWCFFSAIMVHLWLSLFPATLWFIIIQEFIRNPPVCLAY